MSGLYANMLKHGSLRVVDLFAGAGGFGLGFTLAGHSVVASVEVDRWACETLRANATGGHGIYEVDIRSLEAKRFARGLGPIDVVIGGPPCQGFSIAGPRRKDPNDPRNTLFREFSRLARAIDPPVLIMENVPGLLRKHTAAGERVIDLIVTDFSSLGYVVFPTLLESRSFGVPQIRERLFVFALKPALLGQQGWKAPTPTHGEATFFDERLPYVTLWEAIGDLPEPGDSDASIPYKTAFSAYQAWIRAGSEGATNHVAMKHTKRLVERFTTIGWGKSQSDVKEERLRPRRRFEGSAGQTYDQNNRRMHPDRPCHTLPASFYANFLHPYEHRNFTAREGARIQSFPDRYIFKGLRTTASHSLLRREGRLDEIGICQYSQIGNAVPPLLALHIAQHIAKVVEVPSRKAG